MRAPLHWMLRRRWRSGCPGSTSQVRHQPVGLKGGPVRSQASKRQAVQGYAVSIGFAFRASSPPPSVCLLLPAPQPKPPLALPPSCRRRAAACGSRRVSRGDPAGAAHVLGNQGAGLAGGQAALERRLSVLPGCTLLLRRAACHVFKQPGQPSFAALQQHCSSRLTAAAAAAALP